MQAIIILLAAFSAPTVGAHSSRGLQARGRQNHLHIPATTRELSNLTTSNGDQPHELHVGALSSPHAGCEVDGDYNCSGTCVIGTEVHNIGVEYNLLETFGGDFVRNTITNPASQFHEVEHYTLTPGTTHSYSGMTVNRSDVPGGGSVFYEDVYFVDDCASFTKIVKGTLPAPAVLCRVSCARL